MGLPMKRLAILPVLCAAILMGCSSSNEPEATAGTSDALSRPNAYDALINDSVFKDKGHLACGRTLVLHHDWFPTGTYEFTYQPCDEQGGVMRSHGTFEVIGGWGGGLITNPTLKITPDASLKDTTPWQYEIIAQDEEHVWLENENGTLRPQSQLD